MSDAEMIANLFENHMRFLCSKHRWADPVMHGSSCTITASLEGGAKQVKVIDLQGHGVRLEMSSFAYDPPVTISPDVTLWLLRRNARIVLGGWSLADSGGRQTLVLVVHFQEFSEHTVRTIIEIMARECRDVEAALTAFIDN